MLVPRAQPRPRPPHDGADGVVVGVGVGVVVGVGVRREHSGKHLPRELRTIGKYGHLCEGCVGVGVVCRCGCAGWV